MNQSLEKWKRQFCKGLEVERVFKLNCWTLILSSSFSLLTEVPHLFIYLLSPPDWSCSTDKQLLYIYSIEFITINPINLSFLNIVTVDLIFLFSFSFLSLMGNFASIHHHPRPTSIVLLYDGSTREFEDPPTVAELMLDHPWHVVVEFHSAVDGTRRPAVLPADKTLEAKKLYIMLPMMNKLQRNNHRISRLPPLSAEESRRFLSMANSALRSRPYMKPKAAFVPVLSRVCVNAKDHVSGERRPSSSRGGVLLEKAAEEEARAEPRHVREFREVMLEGSNGMAMMSRQVSGKAWRPSLEAIAEKKAEVKAPHSHSLF